jgi:hypothetical protein
MKSTLYNHIMRGERVNVLLASVLGLGTCVVCTISMLNLNRLEANWRGGEFYEFGEFGEFGEFYELMQRGRLKVTWDLWDFWNSASFDKLPHQFTIHYHHTLITELSTMDYGLSTIDYRLSTINYQLPSDVTIRQCRNSTIR